MSEIHDILVRMRADVSDALGKLGQVDTKVKSTSSSFDSLKSAGSVAAGMLMRDVVQGATRAFGETVKLGGEIDTLEASFAAMLPEGMDAVEALDDLREATKGTVSDVDLLTSANTALALGLPAEGLRDMFAAALDVGHAVGRTTVQAVDDLTRGMGRMSPLILDNLGIIVDTETAYEDYAETVGKTAAELTKAEKAAAFQAAALASLNEKAATLGGVTSEATLSQERFTAGVENAKTKVGEFLTPLGAVAPVMEAMMPAFGTFVATALPGMIKGIGGVSAVIPKLVGLIGAAGPLGIAIVAIGAAVALFALAWKNNWFGIRDKAKVAIDAITGAFEGLQTWLGDIGKAWKEFWGGAKKESKDAASDISDDFKTIELGESPGGIRDVIKAAEDLDKVWSKTVGGLKTPEAEFAIGAGAAVGGGITIHMGGIHIGTMGSDVDEEELQRKVRRSLLDALKDAGVVY